MEGIVIIHKPSGITSHDVVAYARRIFKMRRVGHAGTLDPMATGVLVLLFGKSTKLFKKFEAFDKAYQATMLLGTKTISADTSGELIEQKPFDTITQGKIEDVFKKFIGDIEQTPPMVSAVKIKGQRLYKLAREGVEIDRPAKRIRIDSLKVLDFSLPEVKFKLDCSKGTYVRKLADDVGDALGCGACISQIERTKVGPFLLNDAVKLDDLNESHVFSWKGNGRN